uniref:Reverse transcriptase domain-containing protein n=1 Tax=Cannabis sativa TaxID=3483 RepID=A0A803NIX6_CANSA
MNPSSAYPSNTSDQPNNISPHPIASIFSSIICPINSSPIMTPTVLTSISKGKDPMYPECTRVSSETPPEPIRPRTRAVSINICGSKRSYTRQSSQVGSSVRSILKRARSTNSDFDVVPSIFDTDEQAGFNDKSSTNPPPSHAMINFQNPITKFDLHPLPFVGNRFTWKHDQTRERLHWGIVNKAWDNLFPMANIAHLPFYGSDHRAIKVECNPTPYLCKRANHLFFENHWLMDPDFFPLMRKSCMIVTSFPDICATFVDFYKNLFTTTEIDMESINTVLHGITHRITPDQFSFLNKNFDFSEVKLALFQLFGDKAPDPDGLNPLFYQKNWHILGSTFGHAVFDVLNKGASITSINETYLVLIPEKVMPPKLKTVLTTLISYNQGAFLNNRIIFDNILIANEVINAINGRKNGKVGWAALKLNMEKAFDKVYPTVSFKLCINNGISSPITPSRGIRQGDPLSPYLFLLVAEGLSDIVRSKEHANLFKGVSICRSAPSISHLLFANDNLLFTQLEKLMANFWWGSKGQNKSKIHWKSWHNLCKSKFFGDLGFSLLWGRNLLSKCLDWKIGDGKSIPSLSPNWLPDYGHPCYKDDSLPPENTISYFINDNGNWDLHKLNSFFDKDLVQSILSTPTNPSSKDCLIWGHDPSGILTIKSAYHLANSHHSSPSSSNRSSLKSWNIMKLNPKSFQISSFNKVAPLQTSLKTLSKLPLVFTSSVLMQLFRVTLISKPIFAEVEALLRALRWCTMVKFSIGLIISDCQLLIKKIGQRQHNFSALSDRVWQIISSLSHFPDASTCFIPRIHNTLEHNIAHRSLGTNEEVLWNNCVPFS